jgi:Ca2+-binding RTX toxin-like protein
LAGADGDPEVYQALTFTIFSQPTLGTITGFKPATGELVYTPRQNALGIDRFTFAVTDDETAGDPANRVSAPATVEVRVHPVVQAPVVGSGTNAMVLRRVGNNLRLELANAREPLFDQPLANVQKLTILGSPANADQLTVDFAAGGVFPLDGGLVFNGRSFGADALAVRGRSGADAFALQRGQLTANGVTVLFQNVAQVRLDGGAGNDSYTLAALDYPVRIVDSSGVDQLDFSPWIYGSGVNLNLARTKGEAQQVNILAATLALSGTFENVVGTPWNDTIRGNAAANRLWGGDGDDVLYGLGGNDFLHGGAGNDVLFAGTGADFLFGGLGNDALIASSGRAILVGGEGTDELQGSTGESIFIGGTTAYDNNNDALAAIMSEWGSSRSFTDRVNRLRTGVGPNRSVFLRLNESVFDDLLQDRMIGGKAKEWFLAFAASDLVENFGAGDIQSVVSAAKR